MISQLALFAAHSAREAYLARYAADHGAYLMHLRALAVEYARAHGVVTIDDVRLRMSELSVPLPGSIGVIGGERIFGAVLRGCPELVAVGERLSSRPERIARGGRGASHITIYALRGVERAA